MPATAMAYFQGDIVPLAEAKIGLNTHALLYGTGVFEGIRANWNPEHEELYLFRMHEHYVRLRKSAHALMMDVPLTEEDLLRRTVELIRQGDLREDLYVRPMIYKAQTRGSISLSDADHDCMILARPFGSYFDDDLGLHVGTSSWRRTDDTSMPMRAKMTGSYINSALAKTEAELNGFNEAILLNQDGTIAEGSGENVFALMDGTLYTPPSTDNNLIGITQTSIIELAEREVGIRTFDRRLTRSDLWLADEVFMTGTAAHIAPVLSVDRRAIGTGDIGPVAGTLLRLYGDAIRGRLESYQRWLTPVYELN